MLSPDMVFFHFLSLFINHLQISGLPAASYPHYTRRKQTLEIFREQTMADFALGLTKTAVEGTLSRVQLAIDEENKLRVTAKQDLRYITAEFQMMQSFLKVVNKERANNEVVKTWVKQLRDLAFDVEDCVEFVVHLDNNNTTLIWLWRLVPSCMAPPRTRELDRAVAELKQLKARVEEVSQRNTRYNLISDSGSQAKTTTPTEQAALVTTNPSAFHMLTEVWEAAGKRRGMSDLQELIMGEGSDLQTISVWGSSAADLGTTSIFSMLYGDPGICRAFKRRAWVKLTHPFKPDEFIKSLLTQFYVSSHQKNIAVDRLTEAELMQQVNAHKYLIILEEVFSVVDWDAIRVCLPDNENGSRIIVSTKQLRTALLCTGGPYKVSELRRFSDDQSLCAFSKKVGRQSGMRDLIWQIRCRSVISVWGLSNDKSTLINKVYTSIVYKCRQFEGVEFQRHSWVNVPAPFNLEVFSRRLLVSFRSEDLQAEEIAVVSMMGECVLTQECCKFLREDDCLVVINGLQSTHDWDLIKAAFLSEPIKGCILIITNESSVATHCVEEEDGVLNIKDLEADIMLRPLIKGWRTGGKEATHRDFLFSIRLGETREWFTKFGNMHGEQRKDLWFQLDNPGVISLWGPAGAGKSTLIRIVYYYLMFRTDAYRQLEYQERMVHLEGKIAKFSWVDVPHPFNLKDFSWRLLLNFHSGDLQAQKNAAVGMMEGQDPIKECSKFLHEDKCVIVIDGLRSTDDWDLIKAALLSDPVTSHIIVITNVASVAMHCVDEGDRVIKINCPEADMALDPPIKGCASRVFSNRSAEALNFINTFRLLGCQDRSADELLRRLDSPGPSVTSLWGIAGVGKSAVARSLYCHVMLGLEQNFKCNLAGPITEFTMCSWVDVRHPFNLTDLSWHLLLDFHSDDLQAKEKAAIGILEGQDPVQECRRIMCEYRSLVVLDGLRSREDWDLIKATFLPDSTNACIIVITNEASVATHCVDNKEDRAVNVKGLEADMTLVLFKQIIKDGMEFTPDEMELSKVTLGRCGGIPKVIATIGQLFTKENARYWSMSATDLLEFINDDFMSKLETHDWFHSLRGLFSWMQSYFDGCSDSLKPCIFYLSIFPPDHKIRQRHLLRRWIAEGYCRDTYSGTAEENGKILFLELISLSIIQQCQKEQKYLYQVNGFFHEYIISRPMEDNLVFALEGNCSPNSQHAGQHLTIREDWDRDEAVFRSMDFSHLRSLTVFGEWMPFFLSSNMSLLRVLDLADTSGILDADLEQIVKVLPRLKFLSLRGCKEISHLPESFGGLRQLQTLDVRDTSIVKLPLCVIKLQKLQYIRAGTIISSDEGDESVASVPTTNVEQTSLPPEGSDDMVTTLPKTTEEVQISTPPEGSDGVVTTLPETTEEIQTSTLPETRREVQTSASPEGSDDMVTALTETRLLWSCRPCSLVSSWLSKLRRRRLDNDGVEVPEGIGSMTALHTIGVVNVNIPNGKAILKELKKVTQLRKLSVSGINGQNIQELCNFISGHKHLESLSVRLDKHKDKDKEGLFACFSDMISQPPKTLKSLKLYGHVNKLPIWIKQLDNLTKFDLELTILLPEDMHFLGELSDAYFIRRLCVKPIQDGELHFSTLGHVLFWTLQVLEIDCTSKLLVTFVDHVIRTTEVLKIHCSGGASLQISGLEHLASLKEVWLKGSYSDELAQELQQQLSEHAKKPVWKLVQRRSS
ncbi:hypothetical protein CFC21_009220 [Triticum aestivum]|uniref:NB-ARC domain-containing protein n=2 Tax=Triticum aestivum TaxID=4565 RepID=A0A9R1IT89_WHEAT|nr:hypothetical protein CFC21_009220 [Triticum aestivum]